MRAIEIIRHTGKPFSSFRRGKATLRQFVPVFLQMHHPRQVLYGRINQRVDWMVESGLLDEVKILRAHESRNALQTVGYQEFFAYLNKEHTFDRAIELIKQNSRRYAKRQITWMRRDGFWKHVAPKDFSLALEYIYLVINRNLQLKVSAPEGIGYDFDTTYPKMTKVLAAKTEKGLEGYFAFEKKPKKTIWYPVQMLSQDKSIKRLLTHEQSMLKEEFGPLTLPD
jgi:hypothetical protein